MISESLARHEEVCVAQHLANIRINHSPHSTVSLGIQSGGKSTERKKWEAIVVRNCV